MRNKGVLIVISGPSGVGKGTICEKLLAECPDINLSISATTRKPRPVDTEGVTYYFKTQEDFKRMIEHDDFLEWAVYNGNYYGTPKDAVMEKLETGINVLLEIDVQGALNVKERYPDGLYLFIAPPSKEILHERLRGRGTETSEEIAKRVAAADQELAQKNKYDKIVINDVLDDAVQEIKDIIKSRSVSI